MRIIQDITYKNMYYVEWEDGTRSDDFYNKTRAKEHCLRLGAKQGVEDHTLDRPCKPLGSSLVRLNTCPAT